MSSYVGSIASRVVHSGYYLGNMTRRFSRLSSDPEMSRAIMLLASRRLTHCMRLCYNEKNGTYGSCAKKTIETLRSCGVVITYTLPDDPSKKHVVQITDDQVDKSGCPLSKPFC